MFSPAGDLSTCDKPVTGVVSIVTMTMPVGLTCDGFICERASHPKCILGFGSSFQNAGDEESPASKRALFFRSTFMPSIASTLSIMLGAATVEL